MRRVRLARGDAEAAPRVPFPHQLRIAAERFGGRERFRPEVLPQTIGAAKRRDAAGGETPAPVSTVMRAWVSIDEAFTISIADSDSDQLRSTIELLLRARRAPFLCAARNSNACGRFGTTTSVWLPPGTST